MIVLMLHNIGAIEVHAHVEFESVILRKCTLATSTSLNNLRIRLQIGFKIYQCNRNNRLLLTMKFQNVSYRYT